VLLVLGRALGSSALPHVAVVPLIGAIAWAAIALVSHQQRLAALEALEEAELRASRSDASVFGTERADDSMVAARRLQWMGSVLLPGSSVALVLALGGAAAWTIGFVRGLGVPAGPDPATPPVAFSAGSAAGWQLATCVGTGLAAFIFSRFVAGMSKQPAWQVLRGGACLTAATALALLAVAAGLVADILGQPALLERCVLAVGIGEAVLAAEVALNLVLALYRPRRVGELPRAAFESRVLGLVAAPDSIVRSINDAVNYQFGFDITSSWGYQLMLRSVAWLVALGAAVLVALSCVEVVPPGTQAVRLRGGAVVGGVHEGTVMLKWPWPFETALVTDVARVRSVVLGGKPLKVTDVNAWGDEAPRDADRQPYLVAAPTLPEKVDAEFGAPARQGDAAALPVAQRFALVDADVIMTYRIAQDGLLEWLSFASDARFRRAGAEVRERLLRDIALREVTRFMATQPMNDVLSPRGDSLVRTLRERIQAALDGVKSGVEVVAVQVPVLRPPAGEGMGMFEEVSIDVQNARKEREEAERTARASLAALAGSPDAAQALVAAITAAERAEREFGADDPRARDARSEAERQMIAGRGGAANVIAAARARRWEIVMGAAADAADVLGQADAYRAAPELYKQFRTMQVLGLSLRDARSKFILGPEVGPRADIDITVKQAESGLNLADYLDKKQPAAGGEGSQ
jgi:regulator of protease activity HflC (stomatin/prohibitin superfamily)